MTLSETPQGGHLQKMVTLDDIGDRGGGLWNPKNRDVLKVLPHTVSPHYKSRHKGQFKYNNILFGKLRGYSIKVSIFLGYEGLPK